MKDIAQIAGGDRIVVGSRTPRRCREDVVQAIVALRLLGVRGTVSWERHGRWPHRRWRAQFVAHNNEGGFGVSGYPRLSHALDQLVADLRHDTHGVSDVSAKRSAGFDS